MTRKFSKPPSLGVKSRPPDKSRVNNGVSDEVLAFKATYVFERSMLDRFRTGKKEPYSPSPSLDGKSIFSTPEVKVNSNAWVDAYAKISKKFKRANPVQYVRILFKILHGSSLPAPTVSQLASPNMLCYVEDFLVDFVVDIRQQFVAQSQRAKTSIEVRSKGNKQPIGLAIYSCLLDENVSLSPLYRYCLATKVSSNPGFCGKEWADKLKAFAQEQELAAVMEYTIFPKELSDVWGPVIPESFKCKAEKLMADAVMDLNSKKRKER